jgi:hypothetical protein
MVLEKLFPDNWTNHKLRYALLTGFVYSSIAIIISFLLFGKNSGLISVVLTSLLILPMLEKLLAKDEKKEEKEKKFTLKKLFKDNKEVTITYLLLFISIFFTYALWVFIFKAFSLDIVQAFHGQLMLDFMKGGATFMFKDLWTILINNWWVLFTIFLISIFVKDGGIFFITWNASSWGVILSYRAVTSATFVSGSSLKLFLVIFALSAPFILIEALAYIMAAISGNIISKDVVHKSKYVHHFVVYSIAGLGLYLAIFFLVDLFHLHAGLSLLFQVALVLILLRLLSHTFKEKKYKEVFVYNYYLFVAAIIFFIIGALIEIAITQNVPILTKIYATSLLVG